MKNCKKMTDKKREREAKRWARRRYRSKETGRYVRSKTKIHELEDRINALEVSMISAQSHIEVLNKRTTKPSGKRKR